MSQWVMNGESHFFIAREDLPKVLNALRALLEPEGKVAEDLAAAFGAFDFELAQDEDGNITDLLLATEYLHEETAAVLRAIAPFVAEGSYLTLIREDARQWAWAFRKSAETGEVEAHEEDVVLVLASQYRALTGHDPS